MPGGILKWTIGLAVLLSFVLWALIVELGDGTYKFWAWTSESWGTIGTIFSGGALGVFAYLTWQVQKRQVELTEHQASPLIEVHSLYFEEEDGSGKSYVEVSNEGGPLRNLAIKGIGNYPLTVECQSAILVVTKARIDSNATCKS